MSRSTPRFAPRSSWQSPAPASKSPAPAVSRPLGGSRAIDSENPARLSRSGSATSGHGGPGSPAGPTGTAARQAIHKEIAKRLRIDPKVKEAMTEAFAAVLAEFRNATLKDSAVLESVGRQVHGVTGGQMREFARRLRDAVPRPLTEEMILAWADCASRTQHRMAT